uniref:Uncharacterized protein n=1 Tax=Ralstonia solanacearum TaxID=305 RepID=A0A0S4V2P7_RALSL|nr:protein of unknown function [Ralstonia solanacearum]CUV43748.1 protein of unknown function [Ralstonia solanacearum]CUV54441.1 protein of unknown function [Ralstonia solanacearum]
MHQDAPSSQYTYIKPAVATRNRYGSEACRPPTKVTETLCHGPALHWARTAKQPSRRIRGTRKIV